MQPHTVKLGVRPCLLFECKFWLEDDGWNATIELLGLTVHASSFEAAKNDMELRWESTSSYCSENAWQGTVDMLPETLQHSFSLRTEPTKTPRTT
jgi:hypothetical protein